jgi:hypothetical protein
MKRRPAVQPDLAKAHQKFLGIRSVRQQREKLLAELRKKAGR